MRKKTDGQQNFLHTIPQNTEIGRELSGVSKLIDDNHDILELVHNDIVRGTDEDNGRDGMNADQVFRCAILKQYRNLTYQELAFHLEDSRSFRAFARLTGRGAPSASTLQANIKAISADTWKAINRIVISHAKHLGLEKGRTVRIDSTATETDVHYPTDSSLLWDCIRVITRYLVNGKELSSALTYHFVDHSRVAKKHMTEIQTNKKRNKDNRRSYRYKELLKVASRVLVYAQEAIEDLRGFQGTSINQVMRANAIAADLERYTDLLSKVIEQTRLRVIEGKKVPACDKVVSIFETHTDIIAKGNRETTFGHKLFLTGGRSGLILDCVIEPGNPADSSMLCQLLGGQEEIFGRPPRQIACDGGFASKENLIQAKAMGVKDVSFAKRRGIKVLDMVKSNWVYKKLRNFRAGIEANISVLKRSFGLTRCDWRGWFGYLQYVYSSVVSYNFLVLARLSSA